MVGDAIYIGGHFDNICTTARNAAQGGACLDGQVSRKKFAAVDVNRHAAELGADGELGARRVGPGRRPGDRAARRRRRVHDVQQRADQAALLRAVRVTRRATAPGGPSGS